MEHAASAAPPDRAWTCPPAELAGLVAELLARRVNVRLGVSGASMAPLLRDGDTVHLEPVRARDLRFGDLVLYRAASGSLVLHRLLRFLSDTGGGRRLQTRGDAVLRLDDPVPYARVLGRVRRIEKTAPDADGAVVDLASPLQRLRGVATAAANLLASGVYYKIKRGR